MNWLRKIFGLPPACQHKWLNPHATGTRFMWGIELGPWYDCRCEKCGEIRRFVP